MLKLFLRMLMGDIAALMRMHVRMRYTFCRFRCTVFNVKETGACFVEKIPVVRNDAECNVEIFKIPMSRSRMSGSRSFVGSSRRSALGCIASTEARATIFFAA